MSYHDGSNAVIVGIISSPNLRNAKKKKPGSKLSQQHDIVMVIWIFVKRHLKVLWLSKHIWGGRYYSRTSPDLGFYYFSPFIANCNLRALLGGSPKLLLSACVGPLIDMILLCYERASVPAQLQREQVDVQWPVRD